MRVVGRFNSHFISFDVTSPTIVTGDTEAFSFDPVACLILHRGHTKTLNVGMAILSYVSNTLKSRSKP